LLPEPADHRMAVSGEHAMFRLVQQSVEPHSRKLPATA
jgi:hypothetical protein